MYQLWTASYFKEYKIKYSCKNKKNQMVQFSFFCWISPRHLIPDTEQTVLTYNFPKETVTAIMMVYKNTKAIVCSLVDIDFFDIVTGFLQRNTFILFLFIICLECQHKEKFHTKKKKAISREYSAETITDTDYANDDTSTIIGYLMLNPVFTHILNMIYKHFIETHF